MFNWAYTAPSTSPPAAVKPPPQKTEETFGKQVTDMIGRRHCTRSFVDKPVDRDIIEAVLTAARGAPSSQDSQPWQVTVLTGKARDGLSAKLLEAHDAKAPNAADYVNRPPEKDTPQEMKDRMADWGTAFFDVYGLARDDVVGRYAQRAQNFKFFGAPVEMIFHLPKAVAAGTFLDMGLFIQNVLTGFQAYGIGCCPQYSVATHSPVVREYLGMGDFRIIVCGMAVGYPDPKAPINLFVPARAPLEDYVTFLDDSYEGPAAMPASAASSSSTKLPSASPEEAKEDGARASKSEIKRGFVQFENGKRL
jgi:nitroreductase